MTSYGSPDGCHDVVLYAVSWLWQAPLQLVNTGADRGHMKSARLVTILTAQGDRELGGSPWRSLGSSSQASSLACSASSLLRATRTTFRSCSRSSAASAA